MCARILSLSDLNMACFNRDIKLFNETINLFGETGMQNALRWCVKSRWNFAAIKLMESGISPQACPYNIVKEAVTSHNIHIINIILKRYTYYDDKYVYQIMDAIHTAEMTCQHEIASCLFTYLNDNISDLLIDKYGYKISESLKKYIHDRYRIHNRRHLLEKNYFIHIDN
jgi:hypothetical protein